MLMHWGVYRSEIFRISGRFLGYYWYCTSQHFELREIKPNIQLFQYFMRLYFYFLPHRHQQCTALLPEWSKGVDLRPTVSPKRVGSNPTGRKVFVSPKKKHKSLDFRSSNLIICKIQGARKSLRFLGQILFVGLIKKKKVLTARFIYCFKNL